MTSMPAARLPWRLNTQAYRALRIPSGKMECAFYVVMLYSLTADILGVSVPLLAGVSVLALAAWIVVQLRSHARVVYGPIALLIACTASYLVIDTVIHKTPLEAGRPFIVWILQLLLVQALCLRPGFSFRYPLVLLALALSVLPYLTHNPGSLGRARVDVDLGIQGGLSHPNGLAEWFGFFVVYLAILGLEARRLTYRVAAWASAVGCLFVVTLTVGRGPIFAAALAITIGFRRMLRREVLTVVLLIIFGAGIYASGMFDEAISKYSQRVTEKTGREELWPVALETIFASPEHFLAGVGSAQARIYRAGREKANAPHNSFLYFALASGVVPLALFAGFWMQALWRSLAPAHPQESDVFRLPYLIYTFIVVMLADWSFMSPWALLTFSVTAGSSVLRAAEPSGAASHPPFLLRGLYGASQRPHSLSGRIP